MQARGWCAVFFAACLCSAVTAQAGNPEKRACLKAVKAEFLTCKTECIAEKKEGKISCGANPDCHKACEADEDACEAPHEAELEACEDACNTTFTDSKAACKASSGCVDTGGCWTNAAFLSCLRPAGVARYNCVQDCKDRQRLNPDIQAALDACETAADACHQACKVAPTPAPTTAPAG